MTIPNRTVSIKSVFASTANTTIPTPPAPGVSYRNTGTTAAEIGEGWPFKEVVDSAKFNQAMYEYTTICQQLEKYGFLPWSANTDYPAQGCALGSDGKIYQAKQATGPSSTSIDPTTDTSHIYWDLFYYADVTAGRALVSNANGKMAASSVTSTELSYLSGVTSGLQTQINNKANNNAVVHLNGTETITGDKTFNDNVYIKGAITLGTSENVWGKMIQFRDTTGKRIARIQTRAVSTSQNTIGMYVNNADNTVEQAIYLNSEGITYAPTPNSTTSTTSPQIATTGWVNSVGNNVVHKTGDETISGSKTFTNDITVQLQYPYICNKCSDATKGTALSQYRHSGFMFTDKDSKELAGLVSAYNTDKSTYSEIRAYAANSASDTAYSAVSIHRNNNGTGYATAPASDAINSIVTTISKSKSANGHFKLGNGMIVQYGRSSTRTITYPIPFSTDTSFSIVVNNQAGTDGYGRPDSVENLTKTSCMVSSLAGYPVRWIAVGY